MPLEVVASPTALTSSWLTGALRAAGALSGTEAVQDFDVETVGEGVGLLGQLARIRLRYEGAARGAPATIIGKFSAPTPDVKEVARQFGVYEREVRFYQEIAGEVALRVPRCYGSAYVPESGDSYILLEDLTGARLGDQLVGCSLEEARLAVREIGAFHATWWGHPRLPGLTWLAEADAPVWVAVADVYRGYWPNFLKAYGDRLTPVIRGVGERLGDAIPGLRRQFAQHPQTICHGDFRLDNLFFDNRGLITIDWQLAMRGRGIYDVAYFLTQSVSPEFRREHWDTLLREYVEALHAGGVTGYSVDEAAEEARAVALYFFLSPVAWLSGDLSVANERGRLLAEAFLERSVAAIEDLGAADLLGAGG